jgi:hypothetical protein
MKMSERVDRLEKQKAQLDARLSNARAVLAKQARRDETRRKIIAGAWAYDFLGHDWRKVGERLRNAGMLDVRDERLFGLDDHRSASPQSDSSPPAVP